MSKPAPANLTNTVDDLQTLAQEALHARTAEKFETLEQQLGRIEAYLRELQQTRTEGQVRAAIKNLERGKPLTPEDQAAIRAVVVSDAEYYLKHENNLNDWLEELERLMNEITQLASVESDEALCQLRGLMRDAVRLVPNIRGYMEERSRLDRFNSALQHLDDANRGNLVHLLREKLDSSSR